MEQKCIERIKMNKNINSKYSQIIFAVIMSFVMTLAAIMQAYQVQAKEKVTLEKRYFFYVYPNMPSSSDGLARTVFFDNKWDNKFITKAESSDEDVFTVDEEQTVGSSYNISIKLAKVKKESKAELSFTLGGKEYTTDIIVKPYVNPCKTFKIGSKDFRDKFNKTPQYNLTRQKKVISGKTVIKAKKGWKIKKIELNEGFSSGKIVKIKNGENIVLNPAAFEGVGGSFRAVLKNKKSKEEIMVDLWYDSSKDKGRNQISDF